MDGLTRPAEATYRTKLRAAGTLSTGQGEISAGIPEAYQPRGLCGVGTLAVAIDETWCLSPPGTGPHLTIVRPNRTDRLAISGYHAMFPIKISNMLSTISLRY